MIAQVKALALLVDRFNIWMKCQVEAQRTLYAWRHQSSGVIVRIRKTRGR